MTNVKETTIRTVNNDSSNLTNPSSELSTDPSQTNHLKHDKRHQDDKLQDDKKNDDRNKRHEDKRQPKGRFSWVKRLMQNRQGIPTNNNLRQVNHNQHNNQTKNHTKSPSLVKKKVDNFSEKHHHHLHHHHQPPNHDQDHDDHHQLYSDSSNDSDDNNTNSSMKNNNTPSINTQTHLRTENSKTLTGSGVNIDERLNNNDLNSIDSNYTTDNISTIPLKSIVSTQSTKSPSILSESQDQTSFNASTTETSIATSLNNNYNINNQNNNNNNNNVHNNINNNNINNNNITQQLNVNINNAIPYQNQLLPHHVVDRDTESVVTLASSTRRVRRRSIDTNCSTTGIAPASIMERLPIHPNTSSYTPSIRTSEPASQMDHEDSNDLQSEDQKSSIKSENMKKIQTQDNSEPQLIHSTTHENSHTNMVNFQSEYLDTNLNASSANYHVSNTENQNR